MEYTVTVDVMNNGQYFVEIVFGNNVCSESKRCRTRTEAELWIGDRIMSYVDALAMRRAG